MDDAARVRRVQRVGDLNGQIEEPAQRHRLAVDLFFQRAAFEQLEHDEGTPLVLADFVDGADVGMIQRRRGARFAEEALDRQAIGRRLGKQQFERDASPEDQILGEIHLAHAAAAELLEYAVVRQRLADHWELTIIVPAPHGRWRRGLSTV